MLSRSGEWRSGTLDNGELHSQCLASTSKAGNALKLVIPTFLDTLTGAQVLDSSYGVFFTAVPKVPSADAKRLQGNSTHHWYWYLLSSTNALLIDLVVVVSHAAASPEEHAKRPPIRRLMPRQHTNDTCNRGEFKRGNSVPILREILNLL